MLIMAISGSGLYLYLASYVVQLAIVAKPVRLIYPW